MNSSVTSSTRRNDLFLIFILVFSLALACAFSLCIGSTEVGLYDLIRVILGERDTTAARILLYIRLPRMCGAILAGAALAVSGAIIQNVLANPLASPGVIGVNAGAGTGAAIAGLLFPLSAGAVPAGAFLGALCTVLVILVLSQSTGASKLTIVLAGVALSSLCSALTDLILTMYPDALTGYTDFKIGGLGSVSFAKIAPAAVLIGIGLILAMSICRYLDVLSLGTEVAMSLGLPVRRVRVIALALAAALAGAAVSFAGLLGFVGLLVPHILRRFVGEENRILLPACALGGAVLVLVCDWIGRLILAPYEISVGIILALVGTPFFLWLLFHTKRRREG